MTSTRSSRKSAGESTTATGTAKRRAKAVGPGKGASSETKVVEATKGAKPSPDAAMTKATAPNAPAPRAAGKSPGKTPGKSSGKTKAEATSRTPSAPPDRNARPAGSIPRPPAKPGARPRLTISSKNYSSWSLRGWLICKLAGLDFDEVAVPTDDAATRAELLLMSPSYRVPRLREGDVDVWDTLAIADYLHETRADSGIYPRELAKRAHCRAVSGEMHSGFANLRSALPFNVKGRYPGFKIWAGAQADIDHIVEIWRDCLARYGGPFLFGEKKTVADAMYAPVCSRFVTYHVPLDPVCEAYRDHIMALAPMQEWIAAALEEPDAVEELDVEF
jgi:glutathione S-transferase